MDDVMLRWQRKLALANKAEFGGTPSRSVWALAQRLGMELRQSMLRENIEPNARHTAEMVAINLALRLACEVIYRERHRSGDRDWFSSGFGTVSQWSTHQNGRRS